MLKILSVELMKDEHVMFPGAPGPQHKMVASQGFSFSIENKAGVDFVRIKDPRGHVRHIPVCATLVVEFDEVTKVYDNGHVGLERISARIGRGEFVFLVGPTGCGKSTCIRLLMKELEATQGTVRVAGRSLNEISAKQLPARAE